MALQRRAGKSAGAGWKGSCDEVTKGTLPLGSPPYTQQAKEIKQTNLTEGRAKHVLSNTPQKQQAIQNQGQSKEA